jgi:signal transduction histidine kinase
MAGVDQQHDHLLARLGVSAERDVFALRRQARTAAGEAGLEPREQVRLATAVSELGRDLLRPGPVMTVELRLDGPQPPRLLVDFRWTDGRTPGQESLDAVARLLPQIDYTAPADAGPDAAAYAADAYAADDAAADLSGRLRIACVLPRLPEDLGRRAERIRAALRAGAGDSLTEDLRAQTRDLMAALEASQAQHEELQRLNAELEETNKGVLALYGELSGELEETNRGVVALYAELDEKTQQLREASESRTRFWSNVSHELRTPINSVIGLSRLLLDPGSEPLTAEQRQQISLLGTAGNVLLTLVDELLDLAKAEAGRLVPEPALVDVAALLGQLRGIMLATAPAAEVELLIPDAPALAAAGLPELVTDEVMLTRILRNLLSNSLKFTQQGEVRLEVRPEPGDRLLFTVSDTGVGIPPEHQTRVFEEFHQVPGPHQRNRSGTGLGLPYARRLAEALGGTLLLYSRPGEGTVVDLSLPTQPEPQPEAQPQPEAPPLPRLATLLCVDDDPLFREAFRPVLRQLADRVVEVHEGQLAVAAVRRESPDAVLLDLHLPGADGYTVLAELAADPALAGVPVVVMTSAELNEVAQERLGHARGILSKRDLTPRRIGELLAAAPAERTPDEQP